MKKLGYIAALFFMFFLVTACTALQEASYQRVERRACKAACDARFRTCYAVCRDNCGRCLAKVEAKARHAHAAYVKEQCLIEGTVARDLNAYRDPLSCLKVTCACLADWHTCLSNCGGVISKTLQAPPVCG